MIHSQKKITGIDIVIPSYRLRDDLLLPLLQLYDSRVNLKIYLIANNPSIAISKNLSAYIARHEHIYLINCPGALGYSASRNLGIRQGNQEWVLLLDDDISVNAELLSAYVDQLGHHHDAIGFAGLIEMPQPFNAVTAALKLMGVAAHFEKPKHTHELVWTPTANVMLRRVAIPERLFDEAMVYGAEDIDLLSEMSLGSGSRFIAAPGAAAVHPWWDDGRQQCRRIFHYGRASVDVMGKKHVYPFTFLDFPNACEYSLVLLILTPLWLLLQIGEEAMALLAIIWVSEIIVCTSLCVGNKVFSISASFWLTLHQASRQLGNLVQIIVKRDWHLLFRRLDAGFQKPFPSPFRLNRWKIGRGLLILLGILLLIAICTSL